MLEVLAQLDEAREIAEDKVALLVCVVEPVVLARVQVVVLGVVEQTEGVGRLLHQLDLVTHRQLAEACIGRGDGCVVYIISSCTCTNNSTN